MPPHPSRTLSRPLSPLDRWLTLAVAAVIAAPWVLAPRGAHAAPPPPTDGAFSTPPIGAIDIGLTYWSLSDQASDGLGVRATAMAVDRVRGTVVGRFAELRAGVGFDLQGDLLPYELAFKLGVGLATDYFTLFIATGLLNDAFEALSEAANPKAIPSAVGMPMTLGLWITPMRNLYFYAMAEPAWYFGVEERQTTVKPVNVGEEMRARLGMGWELDTLHMRADYIYYQVAPTPLHLFTLGFGPATDLPAF